MRPFSSGSDMTAKCHGCKFAPLGAVQAVRTHPSMTTDGIGRSAKSWTVRIPALWNNR